MELLRKYGEATTIVFPLIDAGAQDFESTPVTFASGDSQISQDEGTFANTTNTPAHEGNGIYSLALTASEMQGARVVVTIIDSATKAWEDQAMVIATYGNASAQHAADLDDSVRLGLTALPNAAADAAGGLPVSDAGGLDMDSLSTTPTKNAALSDIPVYMVDSTDHVTPETGLTLTVERSLDGGAFASATGTAAEIGSGLYQFDASAADMNGDQVVLKFTATGADPFLVSIQTTE